MDALQRRTGISAGRRVSRSCTVRGSEVGDLGRSAEAGRRQGRERRQATRDPPSPDSPSSLPAGCAPDTASHRRRALSRSKRTASGSRPSSELQYASAPPGSAASVAPGAGCSILSARRAVEELRMRPRRPERWVGGDLTGPATLARLGLSAARWGRAVRLGLFWYSWNPAGSAGSWGDGGC